MRAGSRIRPVRVMRAALAMMAGLSSAGMPLSVQFVGRYFEDATVLRVAAAYERGTEWHKKRPPIG